jgi:hypothetical protein
MMWRRVATLDGAQRRGAALTVLLFMAARLGLWVLPFATLRRLLVRPPRSGSRTPPVALGDLCWFVAALDRRVRWALGGCLAQAVAAEALLLRYGYAPSLKIGVRAAPRGERVRAHAWVECEGRVVIGWLDDLAAYTPLASAP